MLKIEDLNNFTQIIDPNNIELDTIADFYINTICCNKYIYTLENNKKISLEFDKTNLCHLLAIHKYNNDFKLKHDYEGLGGFNNIKNKILTMSKLIKNQSVFGQCKNRIIYFPLLPKLLKDPSFIYFDKNIVSGKCIIRSSIVLHKKYDQFKYRIHLFADMENEDKYYPVTFIIHKNTKYIDNQELVNIKNVEIIPLIEPNIVEAKKQIASGL